jgi:hypothetical protein
LTPAEQSKPSNASRAKQRKPGKALSPDQRLSTDAAHVRRCQCPDIAAAAAASTATDLTITLATATTTATATAARMEMNNWDNAEIRGAAGCVLHVSMQCW